MTLMSYANFEEKLTLGSKNKHEEFGGFWCKQWQVQKFALWFPTFVFSYPTFVISHDTKEWSKLWRKTDFLFENGYEELGEF